MFNFTDTFYPESGVSDEAIRGLRQVTFSNGFTFGFESFDIASNQTMLP
jgi:hypothetical protein